MKRWILPALIIAIGVAAIVHAERQHVGTQASPAAMLQMTGEAEQSLSRVPVSVTHVSDADEARLGDELAKQYETVFQSGATWDDATLKTQAYINEVGQRVAAHAQRRFQYKFHLVAQTYFVNAFAIPGGHVFVGRGLINLMRSEDALAATIGHEIAHVELRHCIERAQTQANLRHLGVLGELIALPVEVFNAGYSKNQELEADRHGMRLAVDEGYSPEGVIQLLEEIEKREGSNPTQPQSPADEAANVTVAALSDYFRTHPPARERVSQIQSLERSERWPVHPLRPLPADIGMQQ